MKLTLHEFLFGGDIAPEGFHCLIGLKPYDSKEAMKSFEAFKNTIENLLTYFAWDTEEDISVEQSPLPGEHIQVFEMPSDEKIAAWYRRELAIFEDNP